MTMRGRRRGARRIVIWMAVLLVAVPAVAFGAFFAAKSIRDGLQYDQTVTVRAHLMRFACENCLDMKVLTVSDTEFAFLVDDFVEPYSDESDVGDYVFSEFEVGDESREFCLTGRLHRYRDNWVWLGGAPFSYPLQVDDIDYAEICPGTP